MLCRKMKSKFPRWSTSGLLVMSFHHDKIVLKKISIKCHSGILHHSISINPKVLFFKVLLKNNTKTGKKKSQSAIRNRNRKRPLYFILFYFWKKKCKLLSAKRIESRHNQKPKNQNTKSFNFCCVGWLDWIWGKRELQRRGVHRLGKRASDGSWREYRAERENWQHCKTTRTWFDPPHPSLWQPTFSSSPSMMTLFSNGVQVF